MNNKFVEKYPQLREPQIGDFVLITYFNKPIKGIIHDIDRTEPKYWIINEYVKEGTKNKYWVYSGYFVILSKEQYDSYES